MGPFFWVGQRHPLKNTKTPTLKIIFQYFGCALKFEHKVQIQRLLGVKFHKIFNLSQRCPGVVPELSRRCPGVVPEMSRRCPGDVPEMSRRCPGDVPEDSRTSPTCGLFQIPKIRFFLFFFFQVLVEFFCFCVFCGFLGVLSVLALKRLVAFDSVYKSPFVLFVVQSIPSIFCFTVVLRCFSLLGGMGT